jgi:hypothetical protein
MAKQDLGEHLDPAFAYTDKVIKPIKKEIKQLEVSLLKTQQTIARFMIISDARFYENIVRGQKPEIARGFFTQIAADASRFRAKAITSQDPLSVYVEFTHLLENQLKAANIKLIEID